MGKTLTAIVCAVGVLRLATVASAGEGSADDKFSCSPAYPNGLGARTLTVFVAVQLNPQDGMTYDNPATFSENLADVFKKDVQADAAKNPSGPQIQFVPTDPDLGLTITVYSSGRGHASDRAWVGLFAQPRTLNQGSTLFSGNGPAFTQNASVMGESPEEDAIADAADRFYNNLANGWTCNGQASVAAPTSGATSDASGATGASYSSSTSSGNSAEVASELAMNNPFQHLRVSLGLDAGLVTGDGIGNSATAALSAIGIRKDNLALGLDVRGARVFAGHWAAGATALFGAVGTHRRDAFGLFGGASYDKITDGVLSVFAIHGRLVYGRRLDAKSSLEVVLDAAWHTVGPDVYTHGAASMPFADAAELAATYARGYYSLGVDYRELLGGRFLGVALGFGIDSNPGTAPAL